MTYLPSFDETKTTQLSAYFISLNGGNIYHLMLMKLLYITDRNALAMLGHSVSDDNYASMNYGPVLLNTLSLINGSCPSNGNEWSTTIAPNKDYKLSLIESDINTDSLSDAELSIALSVFKQFGAMNRFDLAEKTHEFSEWKNPHGSIFPIQYVDILKAVGFDDIDSDNILAELQSIKEAKLFLAEL